jgi:hypothetical protein
VFRYASRRHPSLSKFADKITADNISQAKEAAEIAYADACARAVAADLFEVEVAFDVFAAANVFAAITAASDANDDDVYTDYATFIDIADVNAVLSEMTRISIQYLIFKRRNDMNTNNDNQADKFLVKAYQADSGEWYGQWFYEGRWIEGDEGFSTEEEALEDARQALQYLRMLHGE